MQPGLSAATRSNITSALRTVLVAELGIPGRLVQSLPTHCTTWEAAEKDADAKNSLQDGSEAEGRNLGGNMRKFAIRKLPSDAGTANDGQQEDGEATEVLGVAYALPSDVSQEDIDGMDLEEVSAATTEQVYVLTNDASVADQPPSVESVTVVPSGKNGRDDDPGNETPWWIVWVSIGCVIALSVLAIAMVLGAKRKRPRLRIKTDTDGQLHGFPARGADGKRQRTCAKVSSSRAGVDAGARAATNNVKVGAMELAMQTRQVSLPDLFIFIS